MRRPVRIAVTGAAGAISNNLLFKIASGEMFGKDQPVILQLIEMAERMEHLRGLAMELEDCAIRYCTPSPCTTMWRRGSTMSTMRC